MTNNDKTGVTGIILAGGKGLRLGMNKGMALLNGKPMIEYVIRNLDLVCDEILVSSNTGQCKKYGFRVVPDIYQQKGPMAGIHACLKISRHTHNVVVSVDTPFVGPEYFNFLLKNKNNALAAAPWYGKDHYEPLCAYYSKEVIAFMEDSFARGNYKLPDLFRVIKFTPLSIPEDASFRHPMLFHNINTRQDLKLAEQYLKEENA